MNDEISSLKRMSYTLQFKREVAQYALEQKELNDALYLAQQTTFTPSKGHQRLQNKRYIGPTGCKYFKLNNESKSCKSYTFKQYWVEQYKDGKFDNVKPTSRRRRFDGAGRKVVSEEVRLGLYQYFKYFKVW